MRFACFTGMVLVLLAASAAAQTPPQNRVPEATSLLGPLFSAPPSGEARERLEENLAKASSDFLRGPDNGDNIIWLGRRLAYLGRYREAIAVFSRGIRLHPKGARLYPHRGHRYITVRELDRAISDFRRARDLIKGRADEIEPDGAPNARNIPVSTLNFNITNAVHGLLSTCFHNYGNVS